jgi:hypothetical protein
MMSSWRFAKKPRQTSQLAGLWVALMALMVSGCQAIPEEPNTIEAEVYFVSDTSRGLRLFSEVRVLEVSGDQTAFSVLSDLVSGELQPLDPDYSNLWDSSHALKSLTISGSTATLDLDFGELMVGGEGEQRAIDQLVWTLTGLEPSIDTLEFLVAGEPMESLAGHVDATQGFQRAIHYEVLSPVQIVSPEDNQEVENPVVIVGQACTFEANVTWSLEKGGTLIAEGFATAAIACPDRSAWTITLPDLEPGDYVFTAMDISAEDGSIVAKDSKSFIIQ